MISLLLVAFLPFSGFLGAPFLVLQPEGRASFSLLCCMLSVTPSAPRAMQQEDPERKMVICLVHLGITALLVRGRILLPWSLGTCVGIAAITVLL